MTDFDKELYCLTRNYKYISFTGSGGKTSTIITLSNYCLKQQEKVLITTTTHLSKSIDYGNADLFVQDLNEYKFTHYSNNEIYEKGKNYHKVLIEADGARGLPLKYHDERDPVILDENEFTFCIIGLSSIGKSLSSSLYNIYKQDCIVDISTIIELILNPNGVLKNTEKGKRVILLNQADTLMDSDIKEIISILRTFGEPFLISSCKQNKIYYKSF